MRLPLYSSKAAGLEPNLVAIQDPHLKIPTVLVCPVLRRIQLTALRAKIIWHDGEYVVACDLARPVNRRVPSASCLVPANRCCGSRAPNPQTVNC